MKNVPDTKEIGFLPSGPVVAPAGCADAHLADALQQSVELAVAAGELRATARTSGGRSFASRGRVNA
jgi:hypothetical protein